jgi:hypothetical protein
MNLRRKGLVKTVFGVLAAGTMVMASGVAAFAQGPARDASWTSSVTYQNLGNDDTPVTISFYQEGSNQPVTLTADQLPASNPLKAGAATSFFVGGIQSGEFTQGSAVMSASQPLAATVVQFEAPPGTGYMMRLLYNGFSDSQTNTQYLVATTLLRKFGRTTVFSIQNTENEPIDVTVNFYDADANGALAANPTFNIVANSSKIIEMDNNADTGLGNRQDFNGSAIITAEKGDGSDAKVVAAANEYYIDRPVGANFEGMPLANAGNTIYMATALCERFGLDTFYAIQNASLTQPTTITVRYFNLDGSPKAVDGPRQIGQGGKYSAGTCNPSDGTEMTNFTGSATIEATGAPIVAIGKAQKSVALPPDPRFDLVLTAFLGEQDGYQRLALPFVRWASDARYQPGQAANQRTNIAIQNIGDQPANDVVVKYNDKNGNTVAQVTYDIAPKAKQNTSAFDANALGLGGMNPGEFGYYTDATFGGGVIIEAPAGAKLIAVARVQNFAAAEDYNGVPIP